MESIRRGDGGRRAVAMTAAADVVVSSDAVTVDVCDDAGQTVASRSASLDGVDVSTAFARAWTALGGSRVDAIRIRGDGDGIVLLDATGARLDPSAPWEEIDTTPDAGWLVAQLPGGEADWVDAIGSPPAATMSIARLSWLHRSEPALWKRLAHVLLAHDALTIHLAGLAPADAVTDRAGAATTGYWSPATAQYRWDLLAIVDRDRDWSRAVPRVATSGAVVGEWRGAAVTVG